MKKHVFFDLDGTLTDPALGITNSVMYALSSYGIVETDREKLYSFIGPPLVDSFGKHYGFTREEGFEATRRFQEYFSRRGIFENQMYVGIPEVLHTLCRRGLNLYLATSKPEEFALRILDHFSIRSFFQGVYGATMDERERSEKKDVIAYALRESGVSPCDCVMVGDREYDILGAKCFGMETVGVLYGFGSREELERAGADHICHDPKEWMEVLLT